MSPSLDLKPYSACCRFLAQTDAYRNTSHAPRIFVHLGRLAPRKCGYWWLSNGKSFRLGAAVSGWSGIRNKPGRLCSPYSVLHIILHAVGPRCSCRFSVSSKLCTRLTGLFHSTLASLHQQRLCVDDISRLHNATVRRPGCLAGQQYHNVWHQLSPYLTVCSLAMAHSTMSRSTLCSLSICTRAQPPFTAHAENAQLT